MKGARIQYSAREMIWLEENRTMVISDYHRAFQAKFSRPEITAANLHALRKRRGWKVGRAKGRFVGRHTRYSAAEIDWLRDNCRLTIAEYHRQFCAAFERTDVTAPNLNGLRKRKGWRTGRTGHFEKGAVPANKGKSMPFHPNSAATRFKKGDLPHNTKHLGHERMGPDGYVWVSVDEPNPYTGYERRYVQKHRHLWEQANGPIPDGMVLKCLDSNTANCAPSNWEAVPRGLVPRLNGGPHKIRLAYDDAPAELKPTIMAVAKLAHKAHEVRARRQKATAG